MKLAYERWGQGPRTLVALHGFTGSRQVWRQLEPHWAQRLNVIAIDLPGHGESSLAGDEGFLGALDAIDGVCAELGVTSASLLGYSLGARVALGLALLKPGRWERLILESGSPGLRRRKERVDRRFQDEGLAESIERDGVESFVERWESLPLFAGLAKLDEGARARLKARRLACSAEGLADSLRSMGTGAQPNLWPHLPRLRIPVLLITGREDAKFTDLARRMAADLPLCWRKTYDGVHHAPHLETTDAYAQEIASFLEAPWTESEANDEEPALGRTA